MRLLFLGLLLTACPISALAQIAPSPELLNGLARLGAVTVFGNYYEKGDYEKACFTAHNLLYLSLAEESNATAETISTVRGFITKSCS
jgi:hypothetical protein